MPQGIYPNGNKGLFKKGSKGFAYKHTQESKDKMSKSHTGMKKSEEWKKQQSERIKKQWLEGKRKKGWKLSDINKENIRKGHKGTHYKMSAGARKNLSLLRKGIIKHTEQWKEKMRKYRGERHWNWQGGKSCEPYSLDWAKTLKRSIRERDHYICQLCGLPQEDEALAIHHIDYDKQNCNPNNLVSLHRSCHTKTNYRRKYWVEYFSNKLNSL